MEEDRSHNPKHLPYYMDAVEQGHAGMWNVEHSTAWRTVRSPARRGRPVWADSRQLDTRHGTGLPRDLEEGLYQMIIDLDN